MAGVETFGFLIETVATNDVKRPERIYGLEQRASNKSLQSRRLSSHGEPGSPQISTASLPDETTSPKPRTPNELESFTIVEASNNVFDATELAPSVWDPYKNRFRFIASCLLSLCGGLSDAAPGALLPYIEKEYSIGYAVVSIIFVAQALGFIFAAFFINMTINKFGRSKALVLGEACLVAAYVTLALKPPYPVAAFAFFLVGLGAAFNLAICNVFVTNLQHGTFYGGIYQGMYGVGGTIGPLIATSLVRKGLRWSTFYFLPLGIAAFCLVFSGWAFWGYEKDIPQSHVAGVSRHSRWDRARKTFTSKPTLVGAAFIFAYQGAEVAISGWIISFLVTYRGGNLSKVGYVTAGFWGGITLGRFLLSYVGTIIGLRNFVFGITAGTLVLQLLVWFIPSIIGDSIVVAFAGVLLGPVYPAASATFVRLIPKQMQVSSFSFIAGVGSSGGAFIPFLTGLLAQQAGTWVLHPICIALFVVMGGTWFFLSDKHKSTD